VIDWNKGVTDYMQNLKQYNKTVTFQNHQAKNLKEIYMITDLKSKLDSADGLICIWGDEIKNGINEYHKLINDWGIKKKDKPVIILATNNTEKEEIESSIFKNFHILDRTEYTNAIEILLLQALNRTNLFVRDFRIYRLISYIFISISVISLLYNTYVYHSKIEYPKLSDLENEMPINESDSLAYKNDNIFSNIQYDVKTKECTQKFFTSYINLKKKKFLN